MARARFLQLLFCLALIQCSSPEAKMARSLERGDGYFDQGEYREAVIEYQNVLQIEEDHPHAIARLGLAHFQLGQIGTAFRYLQSSREIAPEDTDIRLKLATIYLLARRPEEAREEASYVLQTEPRNLDALIVVAGAVTPEEVDSALEQLEAVRSDYEDQAKFHLAVGDLYIKKRDGERAEQAFKDAAAAEPDSIHAHIALGNLYLATRDIDQAEAEFKLAAELAPLDSVVQIRLVDFYILTRQNDEAKLLLHDITADAPDFLPAWRRLAEIAFSERNYEEAGRALDTFLEKSPNDPDSLEMRGRIHSARGETAEATDTFRKAQTVLQELVKRLPNNASVHFRLAQTHLRLGEIVQAEAELEEVKRLTPDSSAARLLLAELNLRTGDLDPVIEDMADLVQEQPSAQAYKLLGKAHLGKGDAGSALEALQQAVGLVPNDPDGRYSLGLALTANKMRAEAQRQFEAALALSPGYIEPLTQIALIAVNEQKAAEVIERIQKHIEIVPSSGAHYYLLGSTHLAMRNTDEAVAAYVKATELEPRMLSAYMRLASIYAATDQFEEALGKMNEALTQNPDDEATLMIIGILHHQKGDLPKASETYEKILQLRSDFAPAANNLAYILSENEGDLERALQLAEAARAAAPEDPRIADTLGWILYKRSDHQRAVGLLKESATKLPENAEIQYHLGMTHYQLRDHQSARVALKRALDLSSDFAGAEEARNVYGALERLQ